MKLFDLTFKNDIPETDGLFYRGENCQTVGGAVAIEAGGTADFGTYFNLLSYCTYRTYCGVNSVVLSLNAEGSYTVSLCLKTKDAVSILKKLPADGDFTAEIDVSALPDGGYLYFTVATESGCKIYGGAWHCMEEARRNVKIGIAICTYKREGFVKANLARITEGIENNPVWEDRLHVFVVDNAGTLDMQNTPYYAVINNKNLGGSGGFTRGICEIYDSKEYTHMLLMDDDISFDFQTLKRTWRLVSLLTEKHADAVVGGAMLVLEEPCKQHEFGGQFDGIRQHSINWALDMTESDSLIQNENAEKPDYNAWWYCCIPASNVTNYGLPMPFFIKEDDIEYGIRCKNEVICTSGIAVWHSGFSGKYNGALEYYIKRNESVVCAIHCKKSAFTVAIKFLYSAHVQLLQKDYMSAEIVVNGYNDFLKGSKFFEETDPEKLNAEVMSKKQQSIPYGTIEEQCGVNPATVTYRKPLRTSIIKRAVLFSENYMPAFMFKNKAAVVDVCHMVPSRAFLKKTVIKCNSAAENGYICTFDKKRRKNIRKQTTKIFFKLLFGYKKIVKEYQQNMQNMCSRNLWDKLFGG